MKRFVAAAGALALVASSTPALAGGLTGGARNEWGRGSYSEVIQDGFRDISVHTVTDETYSGSTTSIKEFSEFFMDAEGLTGTFQFSGGAGAFSGAGTQSDGGDGSGDATGQTSGPFGRETGHWHTYDITGGGGDPGTQTTSGTDTDVAVNIGGDIVDPKILITAATGVTQTDYQVDGTSSTTLNVEMQENYTAESEGSFHYHEATTFASSF
jgi:hypothetical protein